jgi:hypothetical protein
MSLYTIRRFLFMVISGSAIGIASDQIGQFVAGPALGWTLLLMSCGAWGWHSDRVYAALFSGAKT